jgi:hypothetical protein
VPDTRSPRGSVLDYPRSIPPAAAVNKTQPTFHEVTGRDVAAVVSALDVEGDPSSFPCARGYTTRQDAPTAAPGDDVDSSSFDHRIRPVAAAPHQDDLQRALFRTHELRARRATVGRRGRISWSDHQRERRCTRTTSGIGPFSGGPGYAQAFTGVKGELLRQGRRLPFVSLRTSPLCSKLERVPDRRRCRSVGRLGANWTTERLEGCGRSLPSLARLANCYRWERLSSVSKLCLRMELCFARRYSTGET